MRPFPIFKVHNGDTLADMVSNRAPGDRIVIEGFEEISTNSRFRKTMCEGSDKHGTAPPRLRQLSGTFKSRHLLGGSACGYY